MLHALLAQIGKLGGARFASFTYTNKRGQVSKYQLILGATTTELYRKDIVKLSRMIPLLDRIGADAHIRLAAAELLASRETSLSGGIGNNPAFTNKDTYLHLDGLAGVKMHKETGALYITGLCQKKTVLQEGEPEKVVNSSLKTLAKRRIEKTLASGPFCQFELSQVTRAAMNGTVLELE